MVKDCNFKEQPPENQKYQEFSAEITKIGARNQPRGESAILRPRQIIEFAASLRRQADELERMAERQAERNSALAAAARAARAFRDQRGQAITRLKRAQARGEDIASAASRIAGALGLTPSAVERLANLAAKSQSRASRFDRDREIVARARRGQTNSEIAGALAIHRNTVSRAIRAALATPPPPARRQPAE